MSKRVHIRTLGCRLNEAESTRWARALQSEGWELCASPEQAEVVVLHSCAVTEVAYGKTKALLRRLQRRAPEAQHVLCGCAVDFEAMLGEASGADALRSAIGTVLALPNARKGELVEYLRAWGAADGAVQANAAGGFVLGRTRAFVKVQDGCRGGCHYCIVPKLRGPERSIPARQVLEQIQALERDGLKEVVLTGVQLGAYRDGKTDLAELLGMILAETGIARLRLSSVESWAIELSGSARFFARWKDARLCPHLHLPVQSASAQLREAMGRRDSLSAYRAVLDMARAQIAGLSVSTDVLVGYPAESAAHWEENLRNLEQMAFSDLHLFSYSPRQGTVAARLPEQVAEETKRARCAEAAALGRELKRRWLGSQLGTVHEVLWESRRASKVPRWGGYTGNFIRVEGGISAELGKTGQVPNVQELGKTGQVPNVQELRNTLQRVRLRCLRADDVMEVEALD
ncbi:MAG: MiaB/RimO family radical SAM methylthiotransferase [Myxococcota bacterium]|nr:MiaB/RimO family radical SAM methylthiotransferase [Myxococcota bacterium]